jgi:hypothetical protein
MKAYALFAALVVSLGLAVSAQAAPHGILWARGAKPMSTLGEKKAGAGGNLLYYGGPVIEHAKVYAVFWGDKVSAETKSKIGPFFENILDSTYMDWMSPLYDTNLAAVDGREGTKQHIGRGRFMGAITIMPANTGTDLTDAMLQQELESQIAAGKLPPADDNTLFMTYFPAGISVSIETQKSCETFCAYHEGFKAKSGASVFYGVMPVCGGFGCGFGNAWDTLTAVSSHECIEAVTDPFPTPGDKPAYPQAWNTSGGEEIADLCPSSAKVTGHGLTSTVSQEWDNSTSACNPGPWQQNAAAATTAAAPLPMRLDFKPAWNAAAGVLAR